MNRDIVWTTQFKKDYKLALKRHLNIDLLDDIIRLVLSTAWQTASDPAFVSCTWL